LSLGNWCSTFRGNFPVPSFSRVEMSISFLRGHFDIWNYHIVSKRRAPVDIWNYHVSKRRAPVDIWNYHVVSKTSGTSRHLKLPRLETSGTRYPVTQRHMPAAQRPEWKYMAQGFSHVRLSLACTRARVKWKSSCTPYFY
jgi:hypothetical protein